MPNTPGLEMPEIHPGQEELDKKPESVEIPVSLPTPEIRSVEQELPPAPEQVEPVGITPPSEKEKAEEPARQPLEITPEDIDSVPGSVAEASRQNQIGTSEEKSQ